MKEYESIGALVKRFIKCRNKTIRETAEAMGIKYTTFSEQLLRDTLSADTLFRLAAYLDMDLDWMLWVLGYHGPVSAVEREMVPRMQEEFREHERIRVEKQLDRIIRENIQSTPEARREFLRAYGGNMFYLLDVLVPEEYNIYTIFQHDREKFYVDIPQPARDRMTAMCRRKPINLLYEGSRVLDMMIEERKAGQ